MRVRQPLGHSDSPDSLPSPSQMLSRALAGSPATPSTRHQRQLDIQSPSLHALRARRAEAQLRSHITERPLQQQSSSPLFLSSEDVPKYPEVQKLPSRQEIRAQERAQKQKERLADLAKRQCLREANKIRHNKTDAMRDIIVYIDGALIANNGVLSSSYEQIRTRLVEHGVEIVVRQEVQSSCIFFERRVRATYDPEEQLWMPLESERIVREPTVAVLVSGEYVVDALEHNSLKNDIHEACRRCKSENEVNGEHVQVLLIVVGLEAYFRKQRASRNRAYTQAVRRRLQGEGPATQAAPLNESSQLEQVNSGLLGMQMLHRCHVFRLGTATELADCLHSITGDVAVRPYK